MLGFCAHSLALAWREVQYKMHRQSATWKTLSYQTKETGRLNDVPKIIRNNWSVFRHNLKPPPWVCNPPVLELQRRRFSLKILLKMKIFFFWGPSWIKQHFYPFSMVKRTHLLAFRGGIFYRSPKAAIRSYCGTLKELRLLSLEKRRRLRGDLQLSSLR